MKLDDRDVRYACFRSGIDYDRFAKSCRESQLDREYKDIAAAVDKLIDEQSAIAGRGIESPARRRRFLAISDEIDRLWKLQDANMTERYGPTPAAPPKDNEGRR